MTQAPSATTPGRLGVRGRDHRRPGRRRDRPRFFPKRADEERLLAEYHTQDTAATGAAAA